MKILTLLLACSLGATTVTVCSSGCDYLNLQTALDATASDCAIDVVQGTAGQSFSGAFTVPYRNCTGQVWVRSSRYAELPAVGTRVTTSQSGLMFDVVANTVNTPALRVYEQGENDMSAVDLGTDVMTIAAAIPDLQPFSCTLTPPPPMVGGTIYYSKYIDATHMQASLTPGGAAINLTGAGSVGTGYYTDPHCVAIKPRSNWRFTGIRFTIASTTAMNNALVAVGSWESNIQASPKNIWFDRVIIAGHGDMSVSGPDGGIVITSSAGVTVSDSYIDDIRCFSCEGKPISIQSTPGPILIRNNYIGGGSIGVLLEGQSAKIPGLMADRVTITGNHFLQPGKNMYREGAGVPTGSCYYGGGSGMFYRNTSSSGTTCSLSGRCYSCQPDNTWAIDTTATYRADDFLLKNPIELKGGTNVNISGNIWQGQQASVDSQGNCVLFVAALDRYLANANYTDNHCRETWGGISFSSYSSPTAATTLVSAVNNLVTDMASPRLLNVNGAASDTVFQVRIPKWTGLLMDHNTHRLASGGTASPAYGVYAESNTAGMPAYSIGTYITNNIWWGGTNGVLADGGTSCDNTSTAWGAVFLNDGTKQVSSNVQYAGNTSLGGLDACAATQNLVGLAAESSVDFASDSSLNTTSPYSASCSSGCAFEATDGSDVGVDLVRLKTAISGSEAGTSPFTVNIYPGSVGAIMSYTAPTTSACTIKLWNDLGRTSINADTNTGGEQVDSRTGSVSQGTWRQVVLGVNTALTASTPYWFTVDCTGTTYVYPFRTLAAGSGTYNVTVQLPSVSASEYSSSADMSSPTVLSSSTAPVIPVPTGQVRYWRKTDGLISAFVAR